MRFLILFALSGCEITTGIGHVPELAAPPAPDDTVKPLDILFVVDNSGSMADNQIALARTIFKPECPISDLVKVPESLRDPPPEVAGNLAASCGLSQLLAAYDRDFRVGVITTDVDACDNAIPDQEGGTDWGFRPQRGCLQPVPSTGAKILERTDPAFAGELLELIDNVGTFGSPFERGLDATSDFFAGDTFSDTCRGDRDLFLRDDAQLLVVYVTDENDCSHRDGNTAFSDETLRTCGADVTLVTQHSPDDCYSQADTLAPVDGYAADLLGLKADPNDIAVAVIGGAVESGADIVAANCLDDTGVSASSCTGSHGLSNFTGPGQPCDPDSGITCCTADAATRYFDLRSQIGAFVGGSICAAYLDPLLTAAGISLDTP